MLWLTTYDGRWIGNIVLPACCFIALIHFWRRGAIRGPNRAAVISMICFAGLLLLAISYSILIWKPPQGAWVSFSPATMFVVVSAMPIQWPANILFGEDSIVEEQLMVPTAILSWGFAGWIVGAVARSIKGNRTKRKAAQPGATDNPDDAQ